MKKTLFALVILAISGTASAAYAQQDPAVQQITCPGDVHSSAVVIAPNRVIGAEHGFAAGGCGTEPLWYDRDLDLYVGATDETHSDQVAVSCEGVVSGQTYRLVGYNRSFSGRAQQGYRTVETETGTKDNMMAIEGGAQTGMSGGAVFNEDDALVGIITSTNGEVTYVREFATTPLCEG